MNKVMIVEDEKLIVEGLKCIINWDKLNLKIEQVAYDGVEAIEKYKNSPVDIIITDITMPNMDGLELIEKIRGINSDVKFIILSGYDDFKYAKKAISLGVENYILKPIDENELENTLISINSKIKNGEEKLIQQSRDINIIKQNLYNRWIINDISQYELEERENIIDISLKLKYYCCAIIKFQRNNEELIAVKNIVEGIQEKLNSNNTVIFNVIDDSVVIIKGSNSEKSEFSQFESKLNQFICYINNIYKQNVCVTIGKIEKLSENLYKSYKMSEELQEYLLIYGYNKVITTSKIINNSENSEKKLGLNLDEFNNVLLSKKEIEIDKYIESIFNTIENYEGITPELIKNISIKMMFVLRKTIYELNISDENDYYDLRYIIKQVCSKETLNELLAFIKKESYKLIDILKNNDYEFSPVVQEIIFYVNKNYYKEMSLKNLAQQFNMNSAYLGQMFSKEVGVSFSEYLNKIRNEKAKEMILKTNLRINDIAKKVGYEDNSYFYRKFKKYYGVGPSVLRNSKIIK